MPWRPCRYSTSRAVKANCGTTSKPATAQITHKRRSSSTDGRGPCTTAVARACGAGRMNSSTEPRKRQVHNRYAVRPGDPGQSQCRKPGSQRRRGLADRHSHATPFRGEPLHDSAPASRVHRSAGGSTEHQQHDHRDQVLLIGEQDQHGRGRQHPQGHYRAFAPAVRRKSPGQHGRHDPEGHGPEQDTDRAELDPVVLAKRRSDRGEALRSGGSSGHGEQTDAQHDPPVGSLHPTDARTQCPK
jgi:hypothetical protein